MGVGGQRFAYLDIVETLGPIYELLEMDAKTEGLFARLVRAGAPWDGAHSVRSIADLR